MNPVKVVYTDATGVSADVFLFQFVVDFEGYYKAVVCREEDLKFMVVDIDDIKMKEVLV